MHNYGLIQQRHANDQLSFADKLGDKLQRLADEMEKRGVQFARYDRDTVVGNGEDTEGIWLHLLITILAGT